MSGINDFIKVAASLNKINRTDEVKKSSTVKTENNVQKADKTLARQDNAQISEAAREMLSLRLDAKRYIDEVENSETLSSSDVEKLKQKIENKYFVNDEVIDKIVDKLVDLPEFLINPSKSQ